MKLKTQAHRLSILKAKFSLQNKYIKNPTWIIKDESVVIKTNREDVELYSDCFEFKERLFLLKDIKKLHWLGRNRPDRKTTTYEERQQFKKDNLDLIGLEFKDSEYLELPPMQEAYRRFLNYIRWAKEHGGIEN